jgi:thiol-disulfide isomerase/thioredoxin
MTDPTQPAPTSAGPAPGAARAKPWRWLALGLAGVSLAGIAAALYGTNLAQHNSPAAAACRDARATTAKLAPLARGEVAAFTVADPPMLLADLAFNSPDGQPMRLSSQQGKVVLVNLWATWCAPCRKEMPALDSLQRELGGPAFQVTAINIDQRNLERPKAWLVEAGIRDLAYFTDPTTKVFQELKAAGIALGMPATVLVDAKGCRLGHLNGAAEWASEDAKALIRAALR